MPKKINIKKHIKNVFVMCVYASNYNLGTVVIAMYVY